MPEEVICQTLVVSTVTVGSTSDWHLSFPILQQAWKIFFPRVSFLSLLFSPPSATPSVAISLLYQYLSTRDTGCPIVNRVSSHFNAPLYVHGPYSCDDFFILSLVLGPTTFKAGPFQNIGCQAALHFWTHVLC